MTVVILLLHNIFDCGHVVVMKTNFQSDALSSVDNGELITLYLRGENEYDCITIIMIGLLVMFTIMTKLFFIVKCLGLFVKSLFVCFQITMFVFSTRSLLIGAHLHRETNKQTLFPHFPINRSIDDEDFFLSTPLASKVHCSINELENSSLPVGHFSVKVGLRDVFRKKTSVFL